MQRSNKDLRAALRLLGISATVENMEQLDVMLQALDVYDSREQVYRGVWKQYGALNNLVRAASKLDRIMRVWWFGNDEEKPAFHKDHFDDALDEINYIVFFIRLAQQGNLVGEAPDRPSGAPRNVRRLHG